MGLRARGLEGSVRVLELTTIARWASKNSRKPIENYIIRLGAPVSCGGEAERVAERQPKEQYIPKLELISKSIMYLEAILGNLRAILGPSWAHPGASWGHLGQLADDLMHLRPI